MEKPGSSKLFFFFLLCSLGLLIALFWAYLSAVILALLISSVSYPLYNLVKKLFRGHDHIASIFMILVLVIHQNEQQKQTNRYRFRRRTIPANPAMEPER